jgi:hypothetical protein
VVRFLGRLALLIAAGIVLFALTPPGARPLPAVPAGLAPGVRGAIHIHTIRSDGTGTLDDVAAAAARAGLQFIIVTDHGDAAREPDRPAYLDGVLCIDAVEISTQGGHVVALGLPKAPYPLGGDPRDVLEDIHRLGGFAIGAHPESPKPDLRWTDWDDPVDGLEWLNADSEWRDEPWWLLLRALLVYPFRPPQALTLLLDRPEAVMRRWDMLTGQRRVVGVAAADAHARVGVRTLGEPYDTSGSLHFPSYQTEFREFSISLPDARLTGEPVADAQIVIGAIRAGRVYSTIDALAGPAALRLTATSGTHTALMGEMLPLDGPVSLRVDAQAPPDARISLLRNGTPIATADGAQLQYDVPAEAAVYRVEVTLPGAPGAPPVPWLVSNPIYAGRAGGEERPTAAARPEARQFAIVYEGGPAREWVIEKSPESNAAIDVVGTLGGSQLLLRYAISGRQSDNPYAAFAMPATAAIGMYDRLVFTARADKPTRLSVQLRAPAGSEGERWRRSIYLDQMPRTIQLSFDDFRPIAAAAGPGPALASVQDVLFVVDTVNTKVGSNGQIWIDDIKYAK